MVVVVAVLSWPAASAAQTPDPAARDSSATSSAPALPPERVRGWQTGLLRDDRLHHCTMSLTLGVAAGIATREPGVAAGATFAIGIAKEISDSRRHSFDLVDLFADGLGTALAALIVSEVVR